MTMLLEPRARTRSIVGGVVCGAVLLAVIAAALRSAEARWFRVTLIVGAPSAVVWGAGAGALLSRVRRFRLVAGPSVGVAATAAGFASTCGLNSVVGNPYRLHHVPTAFEGVKLGLLVFVSWLPWLTVSLGSICGLLLVWLSRPKR